MLLDKIKDNKLTRAFMAKSEFISGAGFFVGNIALLVKNGYDWNLETLAAGLFVANAVTLMTLAKSKPAFMKLCGVFTAGGGLVLGASAYGEPGFIQQAIGVVPLVLAGYMMTRDSLNSNQDQYSDADAKPSVKRFSLVSAGLLQLSGVAMLAYGAAVRDDLTLVGIALSWAVANTALAASDPVFKEKPKDVNAQALTVR